MFEHRGTVLMLSVVENDVAAPGREVATQQQPPEPYGPVADEGAFAQRTDMALRLFSLPRLASFSLPRVRGRVGVGALTPPLPEIDHADAGRNARPERLDDGAFACAVRTEQGDHRSRSTQAQGPALGEGGQEVFRCSPVPPGTGRPTGSAGKLGVDLQPAAAIEGQVK